MNYSIRKANIGDQAKIERLIAESVRGLSREDYDEKQIELSIKTVFGVDAELILDETYFVAEADGKIVGCGGWSKRKTLYGASRYELSRDSEKLNPETDAAKIRAFFIHRGKITSAKNSKHPQLREIGEPLTKLPILNGSKIEFRIGSNYANTKTF